MLQLIGPFAFAVLAAAGFEDVARLAPGRHMAVVGHGFTLGVSRFGALGGYEVACTTSDALALFDRFLRAGRLFDCVLAGETAREILLLEAGVPIVGIDFAPARLASETKPHPESIGLAPPGTGPVLVGIELESDTPAGFTPVSVEGREAGRTLRSVYSPSLRRAIALAELAPTAAMAGTLVRVGCADGRTACAGRVAALPFLPVP